MKTCTNCGEKKRDSEFKTQIGKRVIVNRMCKSCLAKPTMTDSDADQLIQNVARRLFN